MQIANNKSKTDTVRKTMSVRDLVKIIPQRNALFRCFFAGIQFYFTGNRAILKHFNGACRAHACTDAHSDQPVFPAGVLQIRKNLAHQDRAGGSKRMA